MSQTRLWEQLGRKVRSPEGLQGGSACSLRYPSLLTGPPNKTELSQSDAALRAASAARATREETPSLAKT